MTQKTTSNAMGFDAWLTLLFIGLKLTGYIDWSWWWVLSPYWIGLIVMLIIFVIALTVGAYLDRK